MATQKSFRVKRNYTEEELRLFSDELADKFTKKMQLDAEKKATMSGYKKEIDDLEAEMQELSTAISQKYTWDNIMAEKFIDIEKQKVFWKHPETGEIMGEEPLTDADVLEMQKTLSFPADNDEGEEKEILVGDGDERP